MTDDLWIKQLQCACRRCNVASMMFERSPHPNGTALDRTCFACGQGISPNDATVVAHGIFWVGKRAYHPGCFGSVLERKRVNERIAELERFVSAVAFAPDGDTSEMVRRRARELMGGHA